MPNFTDARINESSGLATSRTHANLNYTLNDEDDKPHIFAVNPYTGATVGTCSIKGANLHDPEAIEVDPSGVLWLGDLGDNDSDRTDRAVYRRPEPGPGDLGDLDFTRYLIAYPGGPRNAESFVIHPTTGTRYIISKAATSKLYSLPATLSTTAANTLTDTGVTLGADVSDAAFTPDGRFLLLRRKDQNATVFVYETTGWTAQASITVPAQNKPEGITVARDQKSFWISSEGKFAPIYTVAMPTAYLPVVVAPPTADPCAGVPAPTGTATPPATTSVTGLNLTNWKLTLPTGSKGKPIEIKQPQLATFRDSRYFYFQPGSGTVFKCPGNGVTTKGSSNPRTELREMTDNGTKNASWSTTSGTHTMRVVQKIIAASDPVVVGQVHDGSDDVTVVRLEGNDLWATNGDNPHGSLIDGSYVLGTEFEIEIVATGGTIKTYYNGVEKQSLNINTSGCFFKFGAYNQSHGQGSAVAEVVGVELEVTHA